MPVVLLQLPDIHTVPHDRPPHCPYCDSQVLQGWGQVSRSVQDIELESAAVKRYRCCDCRRTFRHYPQGIGRSLQSKRLHKLAALCWQLGLSSKDVVQLFGLMGVELSRMTVWRDGLDLASQLQQVKSQSQSEKYAIDPFFIPGISSRLGVVLALEANHEKRVVLGTLDEFNPRLVKSWLEQLAHDTGVRVSIIGTDYLQPTSIVYLENGEAPI